MLSDETEIFNAYKNKLKGRLYMLLCQREEKGDWEKVLDSLILEVQGLGSNSINWWPFIGKLNTLRFLSYDYFRKTIFDCISLVSGLEKPDTSHELL